MQHINFNKDFLLFLFLILPSKEEVLAPKVNFLQVFLCKLSTS